MHVSHTIHGLIADRIQADQRPLLDASGGMAILPATALLSTGYCLACTAGQQNAPAASPCTNRLPEPGDELGHFHALRWSKPDSTVHNNVPAALPNTALPFLLLWCAQCWSAW